MWSSIQVLSNQVSKKSFYTFEGIDLRGSHAKLHKNRVKLWEQIEFPLYFAQCLFTEMKSTFIKLRHESLPKDIDQELLRVSNSF